MLHCLTLAIKLLRVKTTRTVVMMRPAMCKSQPLLILDKCIGRTACSVDSKDVAFAQSEQQLDGHAIGLVPGM